MKMDVCSDKDNWVKCLSDHNISSRLKRGLQSSLDTEWRFVLLTPLFVTMNLSLDLDMRQEIFQKENQRVGEKKCS